jgi:hypothetical protein
MSVAALISWFVTAFVGLYLLAVWLIENDVKHRGAVSRLPAPVIGGHVLLALTGLAVWVTHLLSGSAAWGWAALGILAGTATLGLTMFTRWIPATPRTWRPKPRRAGRRSSTSRPNGPSPCPSSSATACSPPRPPPCRCSPC